jgi:hypothetical protein
MLRAPIVASLMLLAAPAGATDLELTGVLSGSKSTWRGDASVQGSLKTALRFGEVFAIYGLGKLGYGGVDQRLLTLVQLGVQIWPLGDVDALAGASPFFRLGIAHQHEEPVSVVRGDPFSAIFGIGDAIRHRGGFEWAAGLDLPLAKDDSIEVFGSAEVIFDWFYDNRGPSLYAGGGLGLGVSFEL